MSYVRPHVGFSTPAWSPSNQQDIKVLESVQIRAVNMISGLTSETYEEKLNELGLMSLEDRRLRFDLIQVFKILANVDNVKADLWFEKTSVHHNRVTRQSADPTCLVKKRVSTNVRNHFFSSRVIDCWNKLPRDLRESQSVIDFEHKLDKHMRK